MCLEAHFTEMERTLDGPIQWKLIHAARIYIYISVYICLPCHSSLRRCVFTPASSFCPSPKLPGIRTGPVLAHARARLLTAAVHDGVSEAPLSRKALLQTPLSRTGREGLKFVMTHLGQITTRVASSSRYTPRYPPFPRIRYIMHRF